MRISIRHQMSLLPPAGTSNAVLQLLLTPHSGATQKIESWSVDMPGIGEAGRFTDAYGNGVHLVNQSKPEGALVITVEGVVSTTDKHGVLGRAAGEPVPALYRRVTPLTEGSVAIFGKFQGAKETRIDVLHAVMLQVGETLGGAETATQSQMAADGSQGQSQSQSGARVEASAEDHAHLFIGAARQLDIPARFVSGYLLGAEDGEPSFHAWAEAYDEALGWIGFDPKLQLCPTDRHVRLAAGLDGLTTQPVRMVPAGAVEHLLVQVEAIDRADTA